MPPVALALLLLARSPADVRAQRDVIVEPEPGAAPALQALLEIEETLLRQEQDRYRRYIALRRQVNAQIERLHARLEELYADAARPGLPAESAADVRTALAAAEEEVRRGEEQEAQLVRDGATIRERLREHVTRAALLRDRIGVGTAAVERPILEGTWVVRIGPGDAQATWKLRQSGTLVSGTYEMTAARTGSLTGTLIDRRVTLQQIDARFGRDTTYFGNLAADGQTIRGTWESLDLSGGRPGFGTFSAARSNPPSPDPAAPARSAPAP